MLFNVDLDLNVYKTVDLNTLIKKVFDKEKVYFNILKEEKQLKNTVKVPPSQKQTYKMISVKGGFSSIAIISYIAKLEKIDELYVSTFRIGKKHFDILCELYLNKSIKNVTFFTSDAQEKVDKKYNYYGYIKQKAEENKWNIFCINNHSKIILMKTESNYYVVETSSNLNENPKIEQFSWENDKSLFLWYKDFFCGLINEMEMKRKDGK